MNNKQKMFFGGTVYIARYDNLLHPSIDKMTQKQNSFFWLPEEVDLSKDKRDFNALTDVEQHIFTSNLKRQILLDSIQGREPVQTFLPICSLPELETWFITWSYFETIHSRSYTHIINNVYPKSSIVFDNIMKTQEIVECSDAINQYYNHLHELNSNKKLYGSYEHKKALYLALIMVNALEGIRFYVSFACSWAFAEIKSMEGNAKIIKLICQDENIHLASTTTIIKNLIKEDKDFMKISKECSTDVVDIFKSVVEQELQWAKYLFKDGSIIGLNDKLLIQYIKWITNKRLKVIPNVDFTYEDVSKDNPLPWTEKWIGGGNTQTANQETEADAYTKGDINNDTNTNNLRNIGL